MIEYPPATVCCGMTSPLFYLTTSFISWRCSNTLRYPAVFNHLWQRIWFADAIVIKSGDVDMPPAKAGAASGVYSTVQQFASALGVSMLGGIFLFLARHSGNFISLIKLRYSA